MTTPLDFALPLLLLVLAAAPVIAVVYAARMNERLADLTAKLNEGADRVYRAQGEAARLRERVARLEGEAQETAIRLDEARRLAAESSRPAAPGADL